MTSKLFGFTQRAALSGALILMVVLNTLLWGQVGTGPSNERDSFIPTLNGTDPNRSLLEASEAETIINRQKWSFEQRAYPFGFIPPDARWKAFEHMKAKMGYQPEKSKLALEGPGVWTSIGPNNLGGRMLAIALHPTDPNLVYCGGADGGVWKSTDGGAGWMPLTDMLPSISVTSLAIDPRNPDTIYAGTGEIAVSFLGEAVRSSVAMGAGVLKSTDGGTTWTVSSVFSRYVAALAIDPRNTQVIYAASRNGVFKSTDGSATWNRSLEGNASDIVIDPNAPAMLYAGLWGEPAAGLLGGIYKTTDGGDSWTRLQTGLPPADQIGRVAFAMAPSRTQTLYAGIATSLLGPLLGIYKTTDGGNSWTLIFDTPTYCSGQCWYDNVMAVDANDPEVVYAGGTPFYKSTDGGKSWNLIARNVHVDYHAIAVSPIDRRTVYVGNDGGMYKSTDDGATWASINNGLVTIQFYALGIARADPTLTLGGTQDNGTLRHNRGLAWSQVLGADGGYVAVDHNNSNIIYAETQGFGFRKSTDGGITWRSARSGIPSEPVLFVTPFVMDPQDAQVLYAGTNRLYKTTNGAGNWSRISSQTLGRQSNRRVSAIGVSPSSTQTIYVGTEDGYVWRTDSGGEPWQLVINGLPNRFVTRIRVHPTNPQTAYATFSGFGAGHVFKTTDGGANWQNISSNLPDMPVNVICIDPANTNALYIGTDLGVFRSLNDGATWTPFNDGFPNVVVYDMEFFGNGNLLRAATHGRGMFQILISSNAPTNIKALLGTPQKTSLSTEFATPLRVLVRDSNNIPVPGVSVTFRAPASGPSGAFPDGTASVTVTTDFNGIAQAPSFTANDIAGRYEVEASVVGIEAPLRFMLETVTDGPRIQSVSPSRAGLGQEIVVRGSNLDEPLTVTFFQQGNVFMLSPFSALLSDDGTAITVFTGDLGPNLAAGPSTLAVTVNGVQSNPLAFEVAPSHTPPVITGLIPPAPSPGQRFMINLDGQLAFRERATITQGSTSFTSRVPADSVPLGGIVVSLPEQGFGPGPATLTVRNENSPESTVFTFNIPGTAQPPNLQFLTRRSAAIGQAFAIFADGDAVAANADKNVVIFTQGERAIQAPAIGFSGVNLVAAIPEGLSTGPVSVRVKSTFPNGEVTSNSLSLQITAAPVAPALSRLAPVLDASIFVGSLSVPGGNIRLFANLGAFHPIPGNNKVYFGQDLRVTGRVLSVDPKGDRLDVTLPETLPPGAIPVSVTSTFNGVESARSNTLTLSVFSPFPLIDPQPASQALTVNTISPEQFTVRAVDPGGQPLPFFTVLFVAPASGPSGTFATTGGSNYAFATTDRNGLARSPLFRANGKTGSYDVIAYTPFSRTVAFSVTNLSPPQSVFALDIPAFGARSFQTATNPDLIRVGYATVTPSQSPAPTGAVVFGWQPAGALLTEAGVGAATPTRSALMFVDTRGSVNTGVALVNPNDQMATLNCTLYNVRGDIIGRAAERTLAAHGQMALFVNEPGMFGAMANNLLGTMSIESNVPIGAVTLRATLNARREVVLTTLPVADASLPRPERTAPVFPHLVIGDSYDNQIILLNAENTTIRGRILFFAPGGAPLNIISGGNVQPYSIRPKGAFFLQITSGSPMVMGYATIEPESGSALPAGNLIYRSMSMGTVITEAGVGATALMREGLIYAESTDSTVTGFALANVNAAPVTVTFTAYDMDGTRRTATSRTLLAGQQMAVPSVDQLFPSARNLKGTLRISASAPVAGVTLRGTTNQRGDLILTTLPVSNIFGPFNPPPPRVGPVLFPHLALGGGFSTQILVLGGALQMTGQVNLFTSDGQPLTLTTK